MDIIRQKILQDLVETELFHTFTIDKEGKKTYRYEIEYPKDKEKFEAEGSTWFVFVQDCLKEYYQKHKESFDRRVDETLKRALKQGVN